MLYAIEERAPRAPALVTGVNVRLPMHLTASGRAMLAIMPKSQVRALYPDRAAFVHRHPEHDQIHTYGQLRAELDRTVARGFATEHGTITAGFSSVAVPVRDHRGWPVGSIAVTFRDDAVTADAYAALAATVTRACHHLGSRIYGVAKSHSPTTRGQDEC